MTILAPTPTPAHRDQYPGELQLSLGRLVIPPGGPDRNRPHGVHVRLQHADLRQATWNVPGPGPCGLVAKETRPVMLQIGTLAAGRRVDLASQASIAEYTGTLLARELIVQARALLAAARPQDTWAVRTVRFCDPAGYNDLLGRLSARYFAVRAEDALLDMLADVREHWELQAAWYDGHGPSLPGETTAGYRAEAEAFGDLVQRWLRAARTQMAAA